MLLGRCPSASAAEPARPIELPLAESWPIEVATHHVQGVCVDAHSIWLSAVERATKQGYVWRLNRSNREVQASQKFALGAQFHPGGMQLTGTGLWMPLAEYRPRSTATILCLDPTTLQERTRFSVPDHIGGVAGDGTGRLWLANWDCRQIYLYSELGQLRQTFEGPTGVAYQDFEFHEGELFCAGQLRGAGTAVVDVLTADTLEQRQRYVLTGKTRTGNSLFCREGFCKFGDDFYLLPEDGPHTTLYRFPYKPMP
jgi:hypothetical protein